MGCGAPCANDADMAFIIGHGVSVNRNQNCYRTHDTNRMPALFPVYKAIRQNDMQRIIPDLFREFESQAVFGEIGCRFDLVSLEHHWHFCIDNYVIQ